MITVFAENYIYILVDVSDLIRHDFYAVHEIIVRSDSWIAISNTGGYLFYFDKSGKQIIHKNSGDNKLIDKTQTIVNCRFKCQISLDLMSKLYKIQKRLSKKM